MDNVPGVAGQMCNIKPRQDVWSAKINDKKDCKKEGRRKQPAKRSQNRLVVMGSLTYPGRTPTTTGWPASRGDAVACRGAPNSVRQIGHRPAAERGMPAPQWEQDKGTRRRNIRCSPKGQLW
ncbi:hypothetical protein GCM10017322_39610 [Paracoccus aerius]|nr:hypothetical protein GCM10017322_39610 [Paracoccus aerius]